MPYNGPPPALLEGVRQVLAARVPTGRMPPEKLDGLLRFLRVLSRSPSLPGAGADAGVLGPLCSLAEADLQRRMAIYAPGPLAGGWSSNTRRTREEA
ncbi:hypothetical protein TSOC_014863 [Tetrabaena socialis]|uniref:Uncharacterized protein n=1 Tax=Tetrabaena socialis TaxID=47790 RepID=A0A2J7ZGF9_9CHLO|nr:hypothetical protein TSOC_014863 [Tetrabaena socialis]|eukprot:PNG99360.1 hypothetical protein TSOC_014863 [Tetrabaena socialis]